MRRLAALLLLLGPPCAAAQAGPQVAAAIRLEEPYPNPFRSTARIPFVLREVAFVEPGGVAVTMRIYNLLHQVVAIPTSLDGPPGAGRPLADLVYEDPGRYLALWDGRDRAGRRVAPGPYFVQLRVGDATEVRKILVSR